MNHLERGDSVISFGALSLSQSIALSQWIISDVSQKVPTDVSKTEFVSYIQTDVGAVDGFSGWPLVSEDWLVIGVNSAVFGLNNRISWSTPVSEDTLKELLSQK
jgi:S1-C subfamily serine protease